MEHWLVDSPSFRRTLIRLYPIYKQSYQQAAISKQRQLWEVIRKGSWNISICCIMTRLDKPNCSQMQRVADFNPKITEMIKGSRDPPTYLLWRHAACWQQCHLLRTACGHMPPMRTIYSVNKLWKEHCVSCSWLSHDDEALILHQHTVQQMLHSAR